MKNLLNFDKVVEFKTETNLVECFFFKNEVLLSSDFLTATELSEINKNK